MCPSRAHRLLNQLSKFHMVHVNFISRLKTKILALPNRHRSFKSVEAEYMLTHRTLKADNLCFKKPAEASLGLHGHALQEAGVFFGWGVKRTTINPYNLVTHTVHTPSPSSSCSGDKHKRHLSVSKMNVYNIHTETQCTMQSNHLITQS